MQLLPRLRSFLRYLRMNVLGVDPGLKGALALLAPDESLISLWDMPTLAATKSRRVIDTSGLLEICRQAAEDRPYRVLLEAPGLRPRQAGALTVGRNFGLLEGIFAARLERVDIVQPLKWQKAILGSKRGKDAGRVMAQRLWPEAELGKRKTQDRSDAALIALYGVRVGKGE